jgi:hypothetical protein
MSRLITSSNSAKVPGELDALAKRGKIQSADTSLQ